MPLILTDAERFEAAAVLTDRGHHELACAALARRVGYRQAEHVFEALGALVKAIGYRTEETCAVHGEWRAMLMQYIERRHPRYLRRALRAVGDV